MRAGLISPGMGKPHKPSVAATLLGLGGRHRIDPDTLRSREQEREQREASDTRTDVQRWLGDPPPNRSALARTGTAGETAPRPRLAPTRQEGG
jgi:hypothetical protein